MEGLNEDGQWIILMGLIASMIIFFFALLVNQSIIVGKTTAESVLDFPKSDIQDLRREIMRIWECNPDVQDDFFISIESLALERKGALIHVHIDTPNNMFNLHFNNGVTEYNENYYR
ncbi:MAG TPA: hypothetical protein PLN56_10515 [Methanoregulaceae archaeon]|nr:hypothetical protein [Methanoregulaceae archaeon]HRU80603.1 hypothetical protein [Methanolinea sp.]